MPTAEKSFVFARLEDLEAAPRIAPGATDDGRRRFDVRRRLGITAFGIQAFSAPAGGRVIGEHDETPLGEAGQEELYIVLRGAATFEIDGEVVEAPTGAFVQVQPSARRKATATEDGTTILAVGGTPGEAYKPAPDEAVEAFAAYGARRLRDGAGEAAHCCRRSSRTTRSRTSTPACFAARAGTRR